MTAQASSLRSCDPDAVPASVFLVIAPPARRRREARGSTPAAP
jgi:hypothetical protein